MTGLDGDALFGATLDLAAGTLAQGTLAQGTEPAGGGAETKDPTGGLLSMLPLFVLIYIVFYFLLIRPQRKQQKEHDTLLKSLKKNDTVRTSGGIFGKVVSIEPDQDLVVLEVDENRNVRLKVLRSSIVAVIGRENKAETPAASTAGQSR
jgi:preprotein translocase subunit YajC